MFSIFSPESQLLQKSKENSKKMREGCLNSSLLKPVSPRPSSFSKGMLCEKCWSNSSTKPRCSQIVSRRTEGTKKGIPFVSYLTCLWAEQSHPEKLYISTNVQQGIQKHPMGEGQSLPQMALEIPVNTRRTMKLDPYLTPLTKIYSKCIKDVYIKPATITVLEESVGKRLLDIGLGDTFLDVTPKP